MPFFLCFEKICNFFNFVKTFCLFIRLYGERRDMFERFIRMFCSVLDALSLDQEVVRNIVDSLALQNGTEKEEKENGGEDDEKVDG